MNSSRAIRPTTRVSIALEFFAETDVETTQGKKCHHHADENQVTHKASPAADLARRVLSSYRDNGPIAGEWLIKSAALSVKFSLSRVRSLKRFVSPSRNRLSQWLKTRRSGIPERPLSMVFLLGSYLHYRLRYSALTRRCFAPQGQITLGRGRSSLA